MIIQAIWNRFSTDIFTSYFLKNSQERGLCLTEKTGIQHGDFVNIILILTTN